MININFPFSSLIPDLSALNKRLYVLSTLFSYVINLNALHFQMVHMVV